MLWNDRLFRTLGRNCESTISGGFNLKNDDTISLHLMMLVWTKFSGKLWRSGKTIRSNQSPGDGRLDSFLIFYLKIMELP